MKLLVCLPLLLASAVYADDAADRSAIGRTIAALNEVPLRSGTLARDADFSELDRLWKGKTQSFTRPVFRGSSLSVTISHEPWGEATIGPVVWMERINPRIVPGAVRLITAEVALAEGESIYGTERTRLIFVVKKEDGLWRVVTVRVLA